MPTNRIVVEWSESGGLKARVYDNNGTEHDITAVFQQMSGATGVGSFGSKIELGNGTVETVIAFRPTAKELSFDTTQRVIDQILGALLP
ncbi:hypothetical protein LCGC14_1350600 [marine sediment metagenome]|uniref:Uncharacterized protein n=1 Tax=marine sediment metagenome TaxID=412755 RepID=A0A0F9KX64_9ZZZZ